METISSLKKWWAFIGISLLSFGAYLDYTVVNIALPTIQQELQSNLTSLQWVMNIYFLALCVLATIMGRLGDVFGRRRCLYLGAAIFTFASVIAGCAPTIQWLILGRLMQGVGAAIIFPLGPSLLPQSFPANERAKAIAWLGSIGGIALALGPVLGGIIVTYFGWRWIFFINVPITLLGYLFCINSIKESSLKENTKLDILGIIFLGFAMCGIVLSLIHSQEHGWNNGVTLTYFLIGIISSIVLYKVESRQAYPIIDFKDFANLLFFSGVILSFLAGTLSAVALFFDPLYLQIIKEQSPQFSGFILFAIPIAVFSVAFVVSHIISRIGIINTIIFAIVIALIAMFMQTLFIHSTSLGYILTAFILLGSMWAMGNTVPIIAAQEAVGNAKSSSATGTLVTLFNVGGSIGLSISVAVYHFMATHSLKQTVELKTIDSNQIPLLESLISNPSRVLETKIDTKINSFFNDIFIQGFSSVMWFLVGLCLFLLFSILLKNFLHRIDDFLK